MEIKTNNLWIMACIGFTLLGLLLIAYSFLNYIHGLFIFLGLIAWVFAWVIAVEVKE